MTKTSDPAHHPCKLTTTAQYMTDFGASFTFSAERACAKVHGGGCRQAL